MFFSFFKKVLFGCASLAARERARTKKSARDTANTKPNGRAGSTKTPASPEPGLLF